MSKRSKLVCTDASGRTSIIDPHRRRGMPCDCPMRLGEAPGVVIVMERDGICLTCGGTVPDLPS